MIVFLIIIIAILLAVICFQYRNQKQRSSNLQYIYKKLQNIIDSRTDEKLMLFTDDKEIIPVLMEINRLLAYNLNIQADYSKTEIAMKLEDYFLNLLNGGGILV